MHVNVSLEVPMLLTLLSVELFQAAAHHLMGMRFLEWLHDVHVSSMGRSGMTGGQCSVGYCALMIKL